VKIAFAIHDCADYTGGPAVNAARLLPELKKRGHEVTALVLWSGKKKAHPNADQLLKKGIKCYFIKFTAYSEEPVSWFLRRIQEIEPDVFVANVSTQACFAARWIKEAGIPTIDVLRSKDSLNLGKASFFAKGSELWKVSGIVCVSQCLRNLLFDGVSEPIASAVIPSGVVLHDQVSRQDNSPLRIAYAGVLKEEQKRVGDLIRSFIGLAKIDPDIQFSLIGSEREKGALKKYKKIVQESGFSHRIEFKGGLWGEAYIEELSKHHIIVLLSDYEGLPGSLMDGMAHGLVPVCLRFDGVEELITHGETGFIVEDRSQSFFHTILRLESDLELRKKVAVAARECIKNNYSVEIAANRWEDFCLQLLDASKNKKKIVVPEKLELPEENELLLEHFKKPKFIEKIRNKLMKVIGS